jgi:photosystem II stability/assembly factor-like uncharacterized protein
MKKTMRTAPTRRMVLWRGERALHWLLAGILGGLPPLAAEDPASPPTTPAAAAAASAKALAWTDLTDQLSLARHGLWLMVVTPDSEAIIIAVPDQGLWSSVNAGMKWTQLGKDQPGMAGHISQLICDPAQPKAFWFNSRGSGGGLFATVDGGTTITKLTGRDDIGCVAVDLSDPKRKTLFFTLYDKAQGVQRSVNGGKIFARVPCKLPDQLMPLTALVALDAKTLLLASDCPGLVKAKGKERVSALLRSEDGGTTVITVSKEGAQAQPLRMSTGQLLWPYGLDDGILSSVDQGKTWTTLEGPIHACPCELEKGWLAAVGDRQVQISSNGGKIWQPLGPVLPFAPTGLVYDAKHRGLIAWRSPEGSGTPVMMRLDLPTDLGQVAEVVPVRDLMVWNGDEVAKGAGWNWPKDGPTLAPAITNTVVRQGKAALHLHGEGSNGASFGWNWLSWYPGDGGTDLSGMKTLLLAIRVEGMAKPESLRIALNCSSSKKGTKEIDLVPRMPTVTDGAWHEVAIPLDEMAAGTEFDVKKAWEIDILTSAKIPLNTDIYLDEIGFAR